MKRLVLGLGASAVCVALAGCHTDMWVQPKISPLDASAFYADGSSARTLVPGTVARGHVKNDVGFYTGYVDGKLVKKNPLRITWQMLKDGEDRFEVFCTPCHGRLGDGKGMIAQRGLALRRQPANYNTDRLRNMPDGHFFDVITNGYGVMFPYGSRLNAKERWEVVAYVRALQLSQHATAPELPSNDIAKAQAASAAGVAK